MAPSNADDQAVPLGPVSAAWLAQVGVHRVADVKARDAVELYLAVRAIWPAASLNLLYALVALQDGGDWRQVARERRTELLMRLDDRGQAPRRTGRVVAGKPG
ncbi:TfoX/Sxy family DNA transformation protein [Leptothrix discophora]|uniref:TfoX/Sxy family DNA transformation protein n=1 Tax=Leptothrix discophora TaxID=89 RepID=A0ABT9G0J0_LEPDI|nr:TfoX/Sxy family DNA transformation protein [Leptothrix discophora]MDP4299718.1 TfoX/Sxy family DNA transformation protein [Leptothrix discophora]